LVYIVERLDGGREEKVHCARIIPYAYGMDGTEVPQELLDIADHTEQKYEIVKSIVSFDKFTDGYFFQVRTPRFKRFYMAHRGRPL